MPVLCRQVPQFYQADNSRRKNNPESDQTHDYKIIEKMVEMEH